MEFKHGYTIGGEAGFETPQNLIKSHYANLTYLFPPHPPLVIDPNEECPTPAAVQLLEYLLPPEPPVVLMLLQ